MAEPSVAALVDAKRALGTTVSVCLPARNEETTVGQIVATVRRTLVQRDRLVVYKATYRWTRKGPDRGRWEVDITAEADAPLQAVADVVRGVQRRAGEDSEPELITPAALRQALSDRPWAAAG